MTPILLDYDAGDRLPSIGAVSLLLHRAGLHPVTMMQRHSPGGKGWHVVLHVEPQPTTCMEVAAVQAMLGSDPMRESCNVNRARRVDAGQVPAFWRTRWNVLYE